TATKGLTNHLLRLFSSLLRRNNPTISPVKRRVGTAHQSGLQPAVAFVFCFSGSCRTAPECIGRLIGRFDMKRSLLTVLGLALVLAFTSGVLAKDDKKADTKTITGKSGCAECDGVVKHDDAMHIMLTDKAGT